MRIFIIITTVFLLSTQSHASWRSFNHSDEITDAVRIGAMTGSLNTNEYQTASLVVFCENGGLNSYVTGLGYFPSYDSYSVIWRIDKNQAVSQRWGATSSNDTLWSSDFPAMLGYFLKGSSFVLRADRSFAESVTFKFSLNGFTKAITPALKACNISKRKIENEFIAANQNLTDYKKGVVAEFSGKAIAYDSQVLKFVDLVVFNAVHGCEFARLSSAPIKCIRMRMKNASSGKIIKYTPDWVRKTGYEVVR